MARLYSNQTPNKKRKTVENLKPRKETVAFILNYSKALYVLDNKFPGDTILN